jgi:plastocyanin
MRARLGAIAILAFLVGALGVAFAPGASAQAPPPVAVTIMGYSFSPATLSVPVGTTVTWTNHDAAPHNVVSSGPGGPLHSPTLQQGQSWSYTFTTAGTFTYYCSIHPDMTGTVTVTPSTTPTTGPTPTTTPPTTVPPGTCSEGGLLGGLLGPFWTHLQGAHLETPLGQQVTEALDVDQYVQTHTVLIEHMLAPAFSTLSSSLNGLTPFWVHLQGAHLQTPVGQQVTEALDVDQYVNTHTILLENMLGPTVDPLIGSC